MTDELLEHAKRVAREDVAELKGPDDDILPLFLWVGPHGMGMMPMHGMSDQHAKDLIAAAMMAALVVGRATECLMVTTSWYVELQRPDEHGAPTAWDGVMPSQHPDRVECITIMYETMHRSVLAQAPLTRYPDRPPDMAEWKVFDVEDAKIAGRFGDAMKHGLTMVQESPPEMVEIIEAAWEDGGQDDLMRRFLKVYAQFTGVAAGVTAIPVTEEGTLADQFTVQEMSAYYEIPPWTIREVLKSGVLPGEKVGKSWLIRRSDAEAYAQGYHQRRAEAEAQKRKGDDGQ